MSPISTKLHGILDYTVGLLLIISPWLFNFYKGGAETTVPVVLGILAIIYSLITNYEYGILKIIPINIHLIVDILSGIFLTLSPWIFDFKDEVYLPHVIFGLMEVIVPLLTKSKKSTLRPSSNVI